MRFRATYVGEYYGERHDVFLACDFQHAAKTAESTRRLDERLLGVEVVAEAATPKAILFVPTGAKPREGDWCFPRGGVATATQVDRDHSSECCAGYRRVDIDLRETVERAIRAGKAMVVPDTYPLVPDLVERIVRALEGR